MGVTLSIVFAVILVAIIVKLRRKDTTTSRIRPLPAGYDPAKTGSQFHAVSLQFNDSACEAAKATAGKRFLASAAPRIPLPECDVAECNCRFNHHKDRRRGADRRGRIPENMLATTGRYAGKERRFRERRKDDEPEDFFS